MPYKVAQQRERPPSLKGHDDGGFEIYFWSTTWHCGIVLENCTQASKKQVALLLRNFFLSLSANDIEDGVQV